MSAGCAQLLVRAGKPARLRLLPNHRPHNLDLPTGKPLRALRRFTMPSRLPVPLWAYHFFESTALKPTMSSARSDTSCGPHTERTNFVRCARPSSRRYLQHAPIARPAWPLKLIIGERRDDDAGADRVDPCAALFRTNCLCHDAKRVAALRYLIRVQGILDLVRLRHGETQ